MKIKVVIDRLKAHSSTSALFGTRVAGAAELVGALDERQALAVPHAFVIRGGGTGGEPANANDTHQIRTVEFQIVVAVSNTGDLRGQAATEQVDDVDAALIAALVGWNPTDSDGTDWPLVYVSDEFQEMNRARLFHLWTFAHQTQLGPVS